MAEFDPHFGPRAIPPLLKATLQLDETFNGLRRDLLPPFEAPGSHDEHYEAWHAAEIRTAGKCEEAIRFWIVNRFLPPLEDDVQFFLCQRFEQVAQFVQNFFLPDQTTAITHTGLDVDGFLYWMLVDWWAAHGIREAYYEDVDRFELSRDEDREL
jgi:hypothetical protein